ncbi:hypothetical protein ACFSC4_31230 [Deinococcus malanensis]|uniref:hypothetical protein n=1 Tax=Deinococcus malanensis TaxID=1706855 RepID=UPI00362C3D0E
MLQTWEEHFGNLSLRGRPPDPANVLLEPQPQFLSGLGQLEVPARPKFTERELLHHLLSRGALLNPFVDGLMILGRLLFHEDNPEYPTQLLGSQDDGHRSLRISGSSNT